MIVAVFTLIFIFLSGIPNTCALEIETGPVSQPEATSERADELDPQEDPCATAEVAGQTWLDQMHGFVAKNLCEPAVWFDGFFGEDRVLEYVRPGTFVKWRNAVRWTEGGDVEYLPDISAWWRLPRLENLMKKTRLFIVSGSDTEKFTTQPGQPFDPGFDPETGVRKPTLGVRMDLLTWLRSLATVDTGVKINLPIDPFVRVRYQYSKPFGEAYLIRFTETLLFRYTEPFAETSELDIERKITTFSLLRWSNGATHIGETAGITWNTGISLIRQLSPKAVVSYDANMWGVNHPEWTVQNYRAGFRYRRNIYRPWLFFEVSPEATWPEDVEGHRMPVYAAMGTLEVRFGK